MHSRGIPNLLTHCPLNKWGIAKPFDRIGEVLLVTFHFNPLRYKRMRQTYFEWAPTLGPLRDHLQCYELVFDDDEPEIPGSIVIRGTREANWIWQKEAIVNRALRDADASKRYVAWLDHDMVIDKPDWMERSVTMIDDGCPAVQMVGQLQYLDQQKQPSAPRTSGMKNFTTNGSTNGNPGGAWIADRSFLESIGGLFDGNIVGGGDQCFFDGFIGKTGWHVTQYSDTLAACVENYVKRVTEACGERSGGYLDADVYHLWHGDRKDRQYGERNRILSENDFDPSADVRINDAGILEWSSDKPGLHEAVRRYFEGRREDG
ncbi:hypothetical protein [Rubripirellula lacrimiformis]|nr:hypothetical protein [Rubripirellula lacrimiformis]